jgi:DNA-binding CsgD family transcriptional regulator
VSVTTLLHREHELAVLDDGLRAIYDGRPAVLLIEGPRGIGKTALLRSALARAPEHAIVLRARCHDAEREFGLAMVRQLFDPLLELAGDGPSPDEFAAEQLRATVAAEIPDRGPHDLLRSLFQVIRSRAAVKPVIIAIDDLTSADPLSARWFNFVARRLDGLPVALVATLDTDAAEDLAAELAPLPYAKLVRPGPLCPTCAAEWVAQELGAPLDSELAAACHIVSLGNPQVLRELANRLTAGRICPGSPCLDAVLEIGAATLGDTVLDWLGSRHPAAVDLLTGLAVLGPNADMPTAAVLVGQGEFLAVRARDVLRRIGLISAEPPNRIRHELIRAAVLSWLPAATRLDLHARAAELLIQLGAPARQTAEHLMSLGVIGKPWASGILRDAAREAAGSDEWEFAARYLRQALTEAPDPTINLELVGQLGAVELHRDIAACTRHMISAATTASGPVQRAQALIPFLNPMLVANSSTAASSFVDAALALAAAQATPRDLLLRFSTQALLSGHRAGLRRSLRILRRGDTDPAARGFLAGLAAMVAAGGGRPDTAIRLANRSIGDGDPGGADVGVLGAAIALSWSGRPEVALTLVGQLIDATTEHNHPGERGMCLLVRSDIGYRLGRWPQALTDAREAIRVTAAVNAPGLRAAARACAARALIRQGQVDLARRLVTARAPPDLHPLVRAIVLQATGMVAAADGDHAEALRLFLECGHRLAVRGIANPACVPWRAHAAEAYLALGEYAAARTIASNSPGPVRARAASPGDRPVTSVAIGDGEKPVRLTAGERRVIDLVLQGLSNLMVAERLVLSKRTVDTHLGRVYRKLGICGRPELAAAVERL